MLLELLWKLGDVEISFHITDLLVRESQIMIDISVVSVTRRSRSDVVTE